MSIEQDGDEGDLLNLCTQLRQGVMGTDFLSDGRLLPERTLATRMGVSRARLRQALKVLEREGIIFRRRGQGTFASPPPAHDADRFRRLARRVQPQDIMEVRFSVEPKLAGLAAERASSEDISVLEKLMRATLNATEVAEYETADEIFHYKVAQLAGNPLFLSVYDGIREVRSQAAWTYRRENTYSQETILCLANQHRDLLNSIAARDAKSAQSIMETHLHDVSKVMLGDDDQIGYPLEHRT